MKLIFHPDAEREFHEGIRQHLLIDPALGADFEAKVEEAVALAMSFPDPGGKFVLAFGAALFADFRMASFTRMTRMCFTLPPSCISTPSRDIGASG